MTQKETYIGPMAIELSSYTKPQIVESTTKKWVEYGDQNDYFDYLADRYNGSPTNNAIITATSMMIYGLGLDATTESKTMDLEAWMKVVAMFDKDLLRRTALDIKLNGNFSWQVITTKDANNTVLTKVVFVPVKNIRAGKAVDGEITEYWYSDNWAESHKARYKPEPIPAFGSGEDSELLYVRLLSPDTFYYSPPDYQGGVQYAEMEEEISNFHISNIQNGLAPGLIFNFNNGIPEAEKREELRQDIKKRLGGSGNAGKFIMNFAPSKEKGAEVVPIQLSDADKQYEFLSRESQEKILVAHRVTSPMLVGIKNKTGLGNNADELITAFMLYDRTVIQPFQEMIIDGINKVIGINGWSFDMFFKQLAPIEEKKEEPMRMSSQVPDMSEHDEDAWLAYLEGKAEYIDAEVFDEIEEEEVADTLEDEEREAEKIVGRILKMTSAYADPEEKSKKGDSGLYKIRYRYAPRKTQGNSRKFCKTMVKDANAGAVYRVEDIQEMGDAGVNGQFAPKGESSYSIWLYKGGVNCHHRWTRVVFFRKRDSKGRFLPPSKTGSLENDKQSSVTGARKAGVPRKALRPAGFGIANKRPIDMPNQGRKK